MQYVGDNRATFTTEYGNVSAASIGAIQRSLLALEEGSGDALFGEPALDLADFMRVTAEGKGMVSLLAAGRLMSSPKIYSTFLLWLLAEIFEQLPEVGDPEKPKLVFFFDEAHLLFTDAPDALREKIEQIVRLIRSKGVGVFSLLRTRSTSPTPCWASSAIACSTPCAPTPRTTRKRSRQRPKRSEQTPTWTLPKPSPSSASARSSSPS